MKNLVVKMSVIFFMITGFSTTTKEGVRWNIIGAGTIAGAMGGAAFAPSDERREVHALNWAGIIGLGAAIYVMIFHNDKDHIKKLEDENYVLKNKPDFEIIDEFNARLKSPLFKDGPTEGKWEYRKVDRWLKVNDDQLIHQNLEFKRVDAKSKETK